MVDEDQSVGIRQRRFQGVFDDDDGVTVGDVQIVDQFVKFVGPFGSKADVGSSKTRMSGLVAKTSAMTNR